MWEVRKRLLPDEPVVQGELWSGERRLNYLEVIDLWRTQAKFREIFSQRLADTEFGGFFWETPPVTTQTLAQPFEFVLVEGPMLAGLQPDPSPFANQFAQSREAVLTFSNLGGDATLVVPRPISSAVFYPHLANFLRGAPAGQIDEFWRAVGEAMKEKLSHKPLWLSTAGLGVSWLHLRLDSRPKYYRFRPYKEQLG